MDMPWVTCISKKSPLILANMSEFLSTTCCHPTFSGEAMVVLARQS